MPSTKWGLHGGDSTVTRKDEKILLNLMFTKKNF